MNRFDCEGYIQIHVDQTANIAKTEVNHKCLHPPNAFQLALLWMKEQNYDIILNLTEPVQAIAFTTGIYEHLKKNNIHIHECGVDATCKYF
jgi:hypothetical protein